MQRAKGKIEIFTHIYKLGLLPCSLASGSLAAAAINTEATPQITNLHCSKRTPKAIKTPTANDKTMRVSEEARSASDCSTLKDLENFIDQSFLNVWSPSVDGNILTVQSIDCSTPLLVQTSEFYKYWNDNSR